MEYLKWLLKLLCATFIWQLTEIDIVFYAGDRSPLPPTLSLPLYIYLLSMSPHITHVVGTVKYLYLIQHLNKRNQDGKPVYQVTCTLKMVRFP